jgi:predicted DNA-binding transcriptional regulator YafY
MREQNVVIDYTNYRGKRSLRLIQPLRLEFKSEVRGFAVSEIRTWMPAAESGIAPTR